MKKIIVSASLVIAFAVYAVQQHFGKTSDIGSTINIQQVTQQSQNSSIKLVDPVNSANANNSPQPQSSQFKNGSYIGNTADAYYGNLQVRATISGGRLTNVEFLQYPNDRGHSIEISNLSLPQLRSEAIKAQTASVDIVSGATQTSEAFIQSLQSALTMAKS